MSTRRWQGGAKAVAQVQTFAIAGTWEATDIIRATVGSKTVDLVVGSVVINTLIATVVAAWNALSSTSYPEFGKITASGAATPITFTADTAGTPFTITLTPLESDGSPADAQTIEGAGIATTGTAGTASSGPNDWSTALNWSGGAVPVNSDDVYIGNSAYSILYGLAQSAVTVATLTIDQTFTGYIGLPQINRDATEYYEYLADYLAINATVLTIGNGTGVGSGRIKINLGSAQTTAIINNTGSPIEDGISALILKGTHASNSVSINRGNVGFAVFGGEVATIATFNIGYVSNPQNDVTLYCGPGCTLTTLNQNGGVIELNSAITTITKIAGSLTIKGSGAVTTLNEDGGITYYQSSGTLTTLMVGSGGAMDFSQDMRARTVSACDIFAGSGINDPFKTVTWTAGIDLNRCGLADVSLNLGEHIRLTRGSVA